MVCEGIVTVLSYDCDLVIYYSYSEIYSEYKRYIESMMNLQGSE